MTHDIIRTFDEDIPVSPEEAAQRRAVEWIMTHDLSDQPFDEAASAELAARLPTATEPVTTESVDAMPVTVRLRIPLGTHRRVEAYAKAHGVKATALMREWIEQMLVLVEDDRTISLQDALRALAQLPAHAGDPGERT